jgi:hypothetical protein
MGRDMVALLYANPGEMFVRLKEIYGRDVEGRAVEFLGLLGTAVVDACSVLMISVLL